MRFENVPKIEPIYPDKDQRKMSSIWSIWFDKLTNWLVAPVLNYLQFDTGYAGTVPTTEGTVGWNSMHHTLDVYPGISGSVLQVGQEEWVHVYNNSGSTILNTKAVYINGANTDHPTVALAKADVGNSAAYVLGIATTDIANGAFGFVTVRGMVHDFNTSGFSAGDRLYLSDTVAGALTKTAPISPSYAIPVGVALNSSATGIIYVQPGDASSAIIHGDTDAATLDPTGWINNDAIVISYDSTARTVTLAGTLKYIWRGSIITLTSPWTSPAHSATTGQSYFLYTSDGVNFAWSTTAWLFSDMMVAYVFYGASNKYAIRELHGLMPWQAHQEFHTIAGTYKSSGGTIAGYVLASTTAANRRPTVATTIVKDEDILTTLPTLTSSLYTQVTLTGTGTTNFTLSAADIVPLSGAQPYWNQFTAGAWTQTLMSNSTYMSVWLVAFPVTSDSGSQAYRFLWIQGQTNGSQASEQALFPQDVNLGTLTSLSPEFVFLAKVVIRYTAGNWTFDSVTYYSGTRASTSATSGGTFLSAVVTDSTLTGIGTGLSPLSMNTTSETIATTAGSTGTGALPATPAGFITRTFNGTAYKIPVYPV